MSCSTICSAIAIPVLLSTALVLDGQQDGTRAASEPAMRNVSLQARSVERAPDPLARYRGAAGGAERLRMVESLAVEGVVNRPARGRVPFLLRFRQPASYQSIQVLSRKQNSLGPLMFTLHDGAAWFHGIRMPVASEDQEAIERAQSTRVRRRLLWIFLGILPAMPADGGLVQVVDAGERRDGDRDVTAVEVLDERGRVGTLLLGQDSGLPTKLETRETSPISGTSDRVVTYHDYREVEGIRLPFRIWQEFGGTEMLILSYSINGALPDKLFQAPASEEELAHILEYRAPAVRKREAPVRRLDRFVFANLEFAPLRPGQ